MSNYTDARGKLNDALNLVDPEGDEARQIEAAIAVLDAAELRAAEEDFVEASEGLGEAVAALRGLTASLRPNVVSGVLTKVNEALNIVNPLAQDVARLVGGEPAVGTIDDDDDGSTPETASADSGNEASSAAAAVPIRENFRRAAETAAIVPSGKTPDQMIDDILRREGGFVNDPADRGGPTNFGVTQETLSSWRGTPVSVDDVRALTVEEAKEIFRTRYFTRPRIDQLPSAVQPVVFDMSINHGPGTGIKILQRVLNDLGFPCGVDGGIGNETIGKCQDATNTPPQVNDLINAMVDKRIAFYNRIVANNPSQNRFLNGWLKRAEEFRLA